MDQSDKDLVKLHQPPKLGKWILLIVIYQVYSLNLTWHGVHVIFHQAHLLLLEQPKRPHTIQMLMLPQDKQSPRSPTWVQLKIVILNAAPVKPPRNNHAILKPRRGTSPSLVTLESLRVLPNRAEAELRRHLMAKARKLPHAQQPTLAVQVVLQVARFALRSQLLTPLLEQVEARWAD